MIVPDQLEFSQEILTQVAEPIDFTDIESNLKLAKKMCCFMQEHRGIGLAAPQVGIGLRLFVVKTNSGPCCYFFNPEIISTSEETYPFHEGCLSFPGEGIPTNRSKTIHVRYQNYKGDWCEGRFDGLRSICFQHELDHLNGITMHERSVQSTLFQ